MHHYPHAPLSSCTTILMHHALSSCTTILTCTTILMHHALSSCTTILTCTTILMHQTIYPREAIAYSDEIVHCLLGVVIMQLTLTQSLPILRCTAMKLPLSIVCVIYSSAPVISVSDHTRYF